ncbi:ficolin-1-like [Asterias rubens]|uniref:ficolin-1-like n=1 Tax=Asterias rubens TaxID=7604 RepID=UPI001455D038|nr:ficolin-1-like [Asterias rubens]
MHRAGYRDNCSFPTSLTDGIQQNGNTDTDGGGWTVIQRRQDGSVDFYRTWDENQTGFGDLLNEFWLGNDILRDLTGSGQWELRVEMEDWESNTAWASYGEFAVTGDMNTLHVGSYDTQSTAGDSMASHNGKAFSTKDNDNDDNKHNDCAQSNEGAWWFGYCHEAHLNGKYFPQGEFSGGKGIEWVGWKGRGYSLKKCTMKIRQVL